MLKDTKDIILLFPSLGGYTLKNTKEIFFIKSTEAII